MMCRRERGETTKSGENKEGILGADEREPVGAESVATERV